VEVIQLPKNFRLRLPKPGLQNGHLWPFSSDVNSTYMPTESSHVAFRFFFANFAQIPLSWHAAAKCTAFSAMELFFDATVISQLSQSVCEWQTGTTCRTCPAMAIQHETGFQQQLEENLPNSQPFR
jgi:hypothetical protein